MSRVACLQRRRRSRRPTNLHRALHVGENFTKRRRRALVRFRVETNRPTSDEVDEKVKRGEDDLSESLVRQRGTVFLRRRR